MRKYLLSILVTAAVSTYGQDKYNYVHYNKLLELKGTDYVVATVENLSKLSTRNKYMLFLNTKTGQSKQIDFPKDSYLENISQIKIDSLAINKVIVAANTVNLDGNKSIDWNDPKQIIIISTDGQEKTQLTEDRFFVSTWATNSQTGSIVITGYHDSNNNGKYDKTDKNEILIYDLKTLKLIAKQ